MVGRGWLVAVAASVLVTSAARAGVEPQAYGEVVRLVETLYLYPEQIDAGAMLRAAARGLAEKVDWLMVETDGSTVYLRHGDGTRLGSLSVASTDTLPEALLALEDLVLASGYDVDGVDVRLAVLQGLGDALDRYSTVLAGDRLERFNVRLRGSMVGIGVTLRSRGDALVVRELVAGGPAEQAGLVVGDVVVRIDGISTTNLDEREATRRIAGDAGTQVGLTLLRDGALVEVFLTRAEIVVPNVEHEALGGGVGYIRITHFSQRTDENLRLALDALRAAGSMKAGLVVDLRGNTGGSMKDSARAADEFVQAGVLLRTAGSDGQRVRNLQSRMDAVSVGNEPDVPIAILMDGRTASGSEIMAGALLHLDRAVLVGGRSFGKGTVQKVYTVDPEARLKLTVARYLLPGDHAITDEGLSPDVFVEDVTLDGDGVRVTRDAAGRVGSGLTLPVVVERPGWRGQRVAADDPRVELARRAVIGARGPSRSAALVALGAAAETVRVEHDKRLTEALAARGVDWSLSASGVATDRAPDVEVVLTSTPEPSEPGAWRVEATVTNREARALDRVWVELDSATSSVWRGIAFPIGRLGPGATARGSYRLRPSIGLERREDEVVAQVSAHGFAAARVEPVPLLLEGPAEPELALSVRLVDAGATGRAEITVRNLGARPLGGLEVAFGHPGDVDVELLTSSATIRELAPKASAQVSLDLRLGPSAPERLPLGLVVTQDGTRTPLVEWPVDLPRGGDAVALRAPRITVGTAERAAAVGPLTLPVEVVDDGRVDHIVVYLNGDKVAWAPGGRPTVAIAPTVPIGPGHNRVVLVAYDDLGISRRRTLEIRGETPLTSDAGDEGGASER